MIQRTKSVENNVESTDINCFYVFNSNFWLLCALALWWEPTNIPYFNTDWFNLKGFKVVLFSIQGPAINR